MGLSSQVLCSILFEKQLLGLLADYLRYLPPPVIVQSLRNHAVSKMLHWHGSVMSAAISLVAHFSHLSPPLRLDRLKELSVDLSLVRLEVKCVERTSRNRSTKWCRRCVYARGGCLLLLLLVEVTVAGALAVESLLLREVLLGVLDTDGLRRDRWAVVSMCIVILKVA